MISARRTLVLILASLAVCAAALLAIAWRQAHSDAVVRRATIELADWPAGAAPLTVALASDLHVGGGAMSPARLTRLVDQIAAEHSDLVIFAGDFIDGHQASTARTAAPLLTRALRRLRPPLGTIAVLGNHDQDSDPSRVAAALHDAGAVVLENAARRVGPLAIGGVGDAYSGHDRLGDTLRQLRQLPGARLLVTHAPDIAPALPRDTPLLFAGHTHCGQIVQPLVGALWVPSHYGDRYRCGVIREGRYTIVVGAGLGTSLLPLRLGAPPDIWLLTLRGGESRPATNADR